MKRRVWSEQGNRPLKGERNSQCALSNAQWRP
jgi:hypothetical protein